MFAAVGAVVVGAVLLLDRSRRSAVLRLRDAEASQPLLQWSILDRRDGRPRRREADDAATIEAVARALRSGASVHRALDEASERGGALGGRLRQVVEAASRGRPLAGELQRSSWSASKQVAPALRLLAVAIDDGGATADAIHRSATVVRAEQALRADAEVQSTQARTSAMAIAALPLVFVSLSMMTAPSVAQFLFGRPLGWLVLAVGLGLDLVGWWWMRRLTKRALA
ncbi:MAG: type II secretion system F family protein [Actinomycetota bacterium]